MLPLSLPFPLEWQILKLPSHPPPAVPLSACSSGMKCCRTSFKGPFWPGSSWASCPQQQAPYGFWQDYECLLSSNHSYHKTQIKMDRYVFNEFINLKGFGFLKAGIWLSIPCFGFPWLLQNHCMLIPPTLTAQTFCMVLGMISNEKWNLGMIFRSKVVCFYRTNFLQQLNLLVIGTLKNPRYLL